MKNPYLRKGWLHKELRYTRYSKCSECNHLPWDCNCFRTPLDSAMWLTQIAIDVRKAAKSFNLMVESRQ